MGWADLPSDLVQKIATLLDEIPDYMRFRLTCTHWRSSTLQEPKNRYRPWLLLHSDTNSSDSFFFSISEKRTYKPPLRDSRSERIFSTLNGWILYGDTSLCLLNPLTLSSIKLPPFPTPPPPSSGIRKARFIRPNLVVALFANSSKFSFCRTINGQETTAWKEIDSSLHPLNEIAYHNGRFFVLDSNNGTTLVFDLHTLQRVSDIPAPDGYSRPYAEYLVELPTGELLLMFYMIEGYDIMTSLFFLDDENRKWNNVLSIGNNLLFVDGKQAVAYSAVEGCRGDYAYLVNFFPELGMQRDVIVRVDIKDFLVYRSSVAFRFSRMELRNALWFLPHLCSQDTDMENDALKDRN